MEKLEEKIVKDIEEIKARNKRVEADKAWETSWSRKWMIACLTYAVVVIFFYSAHFPRPLVSAIVPTTGFLLSTITGTLIKRRWLETIYNK